MRQLLRDLLENALSGMTAAPRPLVAAVKFYGEQEGEVLPDLEIKLVGHVSSEANDPVRELCLRYLTQWDWEVETTWSGSTKSNTSARRERIYDLLKISGELRAAFSENIPFYQGALSVVVDDPRERPEWYTAEFRRS